MGTWKLQDAKARLSELVQRAMEDGPQIITRHGHEAVVVVSYERFKKTAPPVDFKSFLLGLRGTTEDGITVERHKSREIHLE
jgi:prevent-host-death family protein